MSERLSSHEIEDVLSSVRRLVTEELAPLAQRRGHAAFLRQEAAPAEEERAGTDAARTEAAGTDSARATDSGKLLLTPSLRVISNELPDRAGRVAEFTGGVLLRQPEAPAAGMAVNVSDEDAEVFFGEAAPLGASGVKAPEASLPAGAEATAIAAEAEVAAEESEPGQALPDPLALIAKVPSVDWMQGEEEWHDDPPPTFTPHARRQKPAEVAPKPVLILPQPVEDSQVDIGAEGTDAEETGFAAVAAEAEASLAAVAIAEVENAALSGAFADAADQAALREMVRALIREELSGELGEKITRNVRKLVRAELNRALTIKASS